jgi:hypothetical protein
VIAVDLDATAPESSFCKTFDHPLEGRTVSCQETNPEGFVHCLMRGQRPSLTAFVIRRGLEIVPG